METVSASLEGVTTPVVTPFDGERIDWEAYERLLGHVLGGGVNTVFPCGTTGEFASLSLEERSSLVERTVEYVPSETTVLVGGTGTSVEDTSSWMETAADLGADAIVTTGPYFHTSNASRGLLRFFERIADRSRLPVILYNIPACTGEPIPVDTVAELATHESIVGLKDSGGDLEYGLRVASEVSPEFSLLQGYDPLLLPGIRTAFDGGVNALSNVVPSAYTELLADPGSQRARTLHRDVVEPLFAHCREGGFAAATKAALAERGVIPSNSVRPPLAPMESDTVRSAVSDAQSVVS